MVPHNDSITFIHFCSVMKEKLNLGDVWYKHLYEQKRKICDFQFLNFSFFILGVIFLKQTNAGLFFFTGASLHQINPPPPEKNKDTQAT